MKKIIFFLLLASCVGNLLAQKDSIKAGWGNLNYSVPESPAFSLLGNNPNNIIEPTSVRSIAINIANYYISHGATIPKNLAVEISPLLLNSKASLNAYNKNKFLYRMRLSVGTNVLDNGGYEIAEGLRFTIIDKTDLRCNNDFLNSLYKSCTDMSSAIDTAIHYYVKAHAQAYSNEVDASEDYNKNPSFKNEINILARQYFAGYMLSPDSISKIRSVKRQELWNKPIWEVGIAAMQNSRDSLISHSGFSKADLWSTFGTHLSKNDQLLVGFKLMTVDSNSTWYGNVAIGARYYYGSNNLRAFVQGEYRYENNINNATASFGCIFNIINGLWGQLSMNFIFDNKGNVIFSPGIDLSFGTPEKKK